MKHTFKLSIDCANAAFCEDDTPTPESAAPELARILRAIADRIESGDTFDTFRNCRDINGNIVGTFALKTEQ
jgi:hypothetical protein